MKWVLKTANDIHVESLAEELRSHSCIGANSFDQAKTLARLLTMRGIADLESAARFLSPSLSHLHPPDKMAGLRAAVDRIDAALERKEPIDLRRLRRRRHHGRHHS